MTPFVLIVMALAAYRSTVLFVKDWMPFGDLREAIWRRWPPGDDKRHPTKFGYLWTCQSCMGMWHAGLWYAAWWLWPSATVAVAGLFAVAGVQRLLAVLADVGEARAATLEGR